MPLIARIELLDRGTENDLEGRAQGCGLQQGRRRRGARAI